MKGESLQDAEWLPTRDLVDDDGTVTVVWQEYIKDNIYFISIIDAVVNWRRWEIV